MLFKLSDIEVKKPNKAQGSGIWLADGEALYLPDVSKKALQVAIGELSEGQTAQFYTYGAWSMHELVAYCLKQTGAARVYIATWTITETPARSLLSLKQEGLITELYCVVDDRVRTRTPKSYQLLQSICDRLHDARCHAKVVVIKGGAFPVTILTSANFTKNPRYESGAIFTTAGAAEFHTNWITKLCN